MRHVFVLDEFANFIIKKETTYLFKRYQDVKLFHQDPQVYIFQQKAGIATKLLFIDLLPLNSI